LLRRVRRRARSCRPVTPAAPAEPGARAPFAIFAPPGCAGLAFFPARPRGKNKPAGKRR